jgi:ribosome-binding protein aMBF1 (putative translation factor)
MQAIEHQEWNTVKINNSKKTKKPAGTTVSTTQPSIAKIIMKEPIGKLIAQARVIHGKNQKELASMIGVSQQFIARWEANKELPNNSQIALLEKTLKVKLPRSQKIYIDEN